MKYLTFTFLVVLAFSCEKDKKNSRDSNPRVDTVAEINKSGDYDPHSRPTSQELAISKEMPEPFEENEERVPVANPQAEQPKKHSVVPIGENRNR